MRARSSEQGQAGLVLVGLLVLLLLLAAGAAVVLRASLVRARAAGTADGAALAAADVLRRRADDLLPRRDARTGRRLPPRLSRPQLDALARSAAARASRASGAELVGFRTFDGPRGLPLSAIATVRVASASLPDWVGARVLGSLARGRSRAGLDYPAQAAEPDRFRAVDLRGFAGVAAVVAAASAQLGWPYLWGGESRAEGGFDCSGLIDYALGAAGFPVGRPTAAGLQALTRAVPLGSARAGDLVFVGAPAHHVGLVVAPGLAIEAPHRGAVVHYEPLADGGWSSAGRLAVLASAPSLGQPLPAWVPEALGPELVGAARAEDLPVALLAAQLEAESGFDSDAVSDAGALGIAQFLPATWSGAWNPWRASSPFDPRSAIRAQARYLRGLVDRADGDLSRALAAYHDGWTGSAAMPWSPVTRAYVGAILRRFGGPPTALDTGDLEGMRAARPGAPALRLLPLGQVTPKG